MNIHSHIWTQVLRFVKSTSRKQYWRFGLLNSELYTSKDASKLFMFQNFNSVLMKFRVLKHESPRSDFCWILNPYVICLQLGAWKNLRDSQGTWIGVKAFSDSALREKNCLTDGEANRKKLVKNVENKFLQEVSRRRFAAPYPLRFGISLAYFT